MPRRPFKNPMVLLLLPSLAGLCACSSSPLERPENQELKDRPPIPRAVSLQVDCQDPERFGADEEWARDLANFFRELNVCSEAWIAGKRQPQEADMEVKISILKSAAPKPPGWDKQAALLNFFAWSAIPILPWFIEDVVVDPGLDVQVSWSLHPKEETPSGLDGWSVDPIWSVDPVPTSFRDRYPLLSWSTPAALLLPPFLLQSGDPKHLFQAIGGRIRSKVVLEVARRIKTRQPEDELLWNLRIEEEPQGRALLFNAHPNLGQVSIWLDSDASKPLKQPIEWRENRSGPERISLAEIFAAPARQGQFLRLEALSRLGQRLRYSLPLPVKATSKGAGGKEAD
ncbi:MAG: hypothetical protein HY717_02460 [Planctomycetes bacterium]|nr:hypothetical protein [Planctomycetota bacterium]